MKFLEGFAKKLKFIQRVINSSRTPEEFLMKNQTYPAIEQVQNFLEKYPISQIIKAQMYNRKEDLYFHDGYFGFVLRLEITMELEDNLLQLLSFGYPESSYINFTLDNVNNSTNILMSVVTKEQKNKSKNKNHQHILTSIRTHIIELLQKKSLQAEIIRPNELLKYYNQRLSKQDGAPYTTSKYIFSQIADALCQIDNDGVLTIAGEKYTVFYTKQYPNVQTSELRNPLAIIAQDFIEANIELHYNISIDFDKTQQFGDNKVFQFCTTFLVKQSGMESIQEIIEYFRYKHDWYIYPNRNSSFQKYINGFPLQYDNNIADATRSSSTNQIFPLNKIAELLPVGVKYE